MSQGMKSLRNYNSYLRLACKFFTDDVIARSVATKQSRSVLQGTPGIASSPPEAGPRNDVIRFTRKQLTHPLRPNI